MKWTVLFIVHGLGDGLQEQSRVLTNLLGFGNWKLKYTNLLYLKSEIDHSNGKSITAVLNKVNSSRERRRGEPDVVEKKFPQINIGNRHRLTEVFSYVKKNYPSEKLMLVVFDHGAGFGMFEPIPDPDQPNVFADINEIDEKLKRNEGKRLQRRFIPPVAAGFYKTKKQRGNGRLGASKRKKAHTDMLTMEELSASIKAGFNRKVDIMIMVNCNMQMIETGYSLRENVDYLVGSESMFWVYGINYREVLWQLDNLYRLKPSSIAALCIKTLESRYERIDKLEYLNDVSFSAIDLKKMLPVYKKLDELAAIIIEDIKNVRTKLKAITKARRAGVDLSQFNLTKAEKDGYEPLFFYDLLWFLKNIGDYDDRVAEIESLFKQAVLNKHIGSDFKKNGNELVSGLSVYLPLTKEDFDTQYFDLFYKKKAKFRIDFADTNWGEFLRTIKKQVEQI
jgi:Clostripain family